MAGIHDRMPVILPQEAWGIWLDPAVQTRELRPLLVPYPSEQMRAHRVGTAVGNVRNDGPELLEPVD